ncbi:RNA polymerase sigma factor [Chitinophaga sancti]|uniref:RNA polymerase sigma-70 factor, ECF subfamily n=1 Tax=Chitinophaga sancti TaxID=1004 RepID=A0A1K1SZX1_9BACT|nr:hypothetical protein [Chitinophaga sancti]WQD65383.1 hypothetical protein U0033_13360 [Chitinophaga sancti]WQG88993.1 hypothetical protein SR876_29110 [Chitinophaga sancti]SFW89804.1 RNA polymerase sigma-70 factor, ECF subfamily [Chitinophaga sancti]
MENYNLLSDKEFVERLRLGDHTAFKEVYKRYWPLFFMHAKRMLGDWEMAKDIVQDIFC